MIENKVMEQNFKYDLLLASRHTRSLKNMKNI